jgi:BASS family bile acid:Na+ symporter
LQFFIGQRLGGSRYPQEAAQSLGQKNTMLTLWMALTFCGPVVALGPAFYVLWHNLWNAWQLGKFRNRNRFQA